MYYRLLTRAIQSLLVVFAAATLAFAGLRLAPGDAATAMGEQVSPEVKARMRSLYGLDEPAAIQYMRWLQGLATGDLGQSTQQKRPVSTVMREAAGNTLMLIIPAFAISLMAGVAIGTWQGVRANSAGDKAVSRLSLLIYSVPEFWLALALMMLFARVLQMLPASGITSDLHAYMSAGGRITDRLKHMVLPVLSVSLIFTATIARYQRSSVREACTHAFVRTAVACGLPRSRVIAGIRRASLLPVITLSGILLPSALGGVIFVEQIFAWPGVGYTLLSAINSRDQAVVAACVVLGSAITALGALLAEALRELVDPRLRFRPAETASAVRARVD